MNIPTQGDSNTKDNKLFKRKYKSGKLPRRLLRRKTYVEHRQRLVR